MFFDWCIEHVQCTQNCAFIVRRTCVLHKRAITARFIYALEKTVYGLKKTIYGFKDYLRLEKDYLRLWFSFFRIVSLFVITWCTFNQSMDKNIWMPYITTNMALLKCFKQSSLSYVSKLPHYLPILRKKQEWFSSISFQDMASYINLQCKTIFIIFL